MGASMTLDGMVLAARDARFAYFVGIEQSDAVVSGLFPVLRIDRHTGESVRIFAAQRSAIAQRADHSVEIIGDDEEARRSILCATVTRWLPAASCLNVYLRDGSLAADHPAESVR